ncbi:unnamed protein product [Parajaminaea phylloscopi]
MTTYHHSENATKYRQNANFVYSDDNTRAVFSLLQAQPGDAILDLGCGSGELTRRIAQIVSDGGGHAVGVDASASMIDAARSALQSQEPNLAALAAPLAGAPGGTQSPLSDSARSGTSLRFDIADGCQLTPWLESQGLVGHFDRVFSNAAIHWMKHSPANVVHGIHAALKPGGTVAAELGGFMNCVGVRGGLHKVLQRHNLDPKAFDPWFFPTAEAYTELLNASHLQPPFREVSCELVPRITPLPQGLRSWLETFGGPFLNALPTIQARSDAVDEIENLLRPDLFDAASGTWTMMYVRLRVRAVKSGDSNDSHESSTSMVAGVADSESPSTAPHKKLAPDAESTAAARKLESDFVNRTVLVHLPESQGRVFKGTFQCVDDAGNVILNQTEEWRVRSVPEGITVASTEDRVTSRRTVGMVMIKGTDVHRIEVQAGWSSSAQTTSMPSHYDSQQQQQQRGQLDRGSEFLNGWPSDPNAYA